MPDRKIPRLFVRRLPPRIRDVVAVAVVEITGNRIMSQLIIVTPLFVVVEKRGLRDRSQMRGILPTPHGIVVRGDDHDLPAWFEDPIHLVHKGHQVRRVLNVV